MDGNTDAEKRIKHEIEEGSKRLKKNEKRAWTRRQYITYICVYRRQLKRPGKK